MYIDGARGFESREYEKTCVTINDNVTDNE